MRRRFLLVAIITAGVLLLSLASAPAMRAQSAPTFKLAAKSAYLRDAPDWGAVRTYSIFQGQSYRVLGRTADGAWLRLDFAGASHGTWIAASAGTLEGDLNAVPVSGASLPPPAATTGPAAPPAAPPAEVSNQAGSGPFNMTIRSNGTGVWDAPRWSAHRISQLSRGMVVKVMSRDPKGVWVEVEFSGRGWVPLDVGRMDGPVLNLPVSAEAGPPTPTPAAPVVIAGPGGPLPPWIPTASPRVRQLLQRAARVGRSPYMFAVAGDCNSETALYLELLEKRMVNLEGHDYLQPTVERFRMSFYRDSLAVNGGFTSASIMDPLWARPGECRRGESPYACELRVSMASVVFISVGTGDTFTWQQFESNYKRLIDYALRMGVVPVLVTKPDSLEWNQGGAPVNYINDAIRRLGQQYQVPVLDFDLASSYLDNHGLHDEGDADFHVNEAAMHLRGLVTLQTLYMLTQP